MTITDDIRKNLANATPLYFAAGTADLAAEKLRELPATVDRLREQAPQRLQTVRETELPRLREQAQTLAVQGMGRAVEYAVRARETYEGLTERGRTAVDTWRGQDAEPEHEAEVTVERVAQEPVTEPVTEPAAESGGAAAAEKPEAEEAAAPAGDAGAESGPEPEKAATASQQTPPQD